MEYLLTPIGLACVAAAFAHGYLGQTVVIDRATSHTKGQRDLPA